MNKRTIAILLALLLCLPCACLANGEEAAEQSEKAQVEEVRKAAPQSANSERAVETARANESASSAQESGEAAAAQADADIAADDIAAKSGGAENVAERSDVAAGDAATEGASPEEADSIDAGSSESESSSEPELESGEAKSENISESIGDFSGADDPESEPGAEVSPGPDVTSPTDPDATPDPGATSPADPDATPSPDATPDPDATQNPDATPNPDASPDPDATPEPETGLRVSVEGATQLEDGSWQIPFTSQEDKLRFSWTAVDGATGYTWEIVDAEGKSVASGNQAETALELAAKDYLTGRFTLIVRAELPEGAEPQEARCTFELKQAEQPGEEQPGGRPSGGFGGGSRPSGTSSASGGGAQGEGGLQITPGEALTSDHASGSKDMTAYDAVALSIDEATQTQLTLGNMELGVSLADGGSFTAKISDGALRLSAEDTAEWSINALALEVLARSGLDELTLISGEQSLSLPTTLTLSGPIYASYRAQGYVSKDFELRATPAGIAVYIDGERYALNADGVISRE